MIIYDLCLSLAVCINSYSQSCLILLTRTLSRRFSYLILLHLSLHITLASIILCNIIQSYRVVFYGIMSLHSWMGVGWDEPISHKGWNVCSICMLSMLSCGIYFTIAQVACIYIYMYTSCHSMHAPILYLAEVL